MGKGFAWTGGSYKPVKLDQCAGYSDTYDYVTIYFVMWEHNTHFPLTSLVR